MDYSLLIGVKKERFEVILHDGLEDTSGGSFDPRNTTTTTTSAGSTGAAKTGQVHSPHTPEAARATISAPNGRITDHARTRSSSVSSRPASYRGTPTGEFEKKQVHELRVFAEKGNRNRNLHPRIKQLKNKLFPCLYYILSLPSI